MANRKRVGLALGGGAARGLAHIGVLEVLEQEGIPIDLISGTSIGALVGAFYASKKDINLLKKTAREVGAKRLRFFSDLTIPRTGILKWHRIENYLKKVLGDITFDDLQIPFSCVATDLDNGAEIILEKGPVWDAVRASATIPGLLAVNESYDKFYVDGGVVNPVPVSAVKAMGADYIIAVNVMAPGMVTGHRDHNFSAIIMKSIYLLNKCIVETSLKQADAVISPDTTHIGFIDFQKVEEGIRVGRLAAASVLPEIKRDLEL